SRRVAISADRLSRTATPPAARTDVRPETPGRRRRCWCRERAETASLPAPCPAHGVAHVFLVDTQLGKLGANCVALLQAHRREDDAARFFRNREVLRSREKAHQCLGQGELILAGELGEHGSSNINK